jgi:hypothetical protein
MKDIHLSMVVVELYIRFFSLLAYHELSLRIWLDISSMKLSTSSERIFEENERLTELVTQVIRGGLLFDIGF